MNTVSFIVFYSRNKEGKRNQARRVGFRKTFRIKPKEVCFEETIFLWVLQSRKVDKGRIALIFYARNN